MTFVCADARAFGPVVNLTGRWPTVTRVAGWDDRTGAVAVAIVGFEPLPGGVAEFFGFVAVEEPAATAQRVVWSGLELPDWIDRSRGRAAVLDRLLDATDDLLRVAAPPLVFRCTRDGRMPTKALEKHRRIGKVFEAHGYEIRPAGRRLGKHSWWAEKRPA